MRNISSPCFLLYRNVCPESSYGGLPAMREEEDRRKCFVLILPPYLLPLYQRKPRKRLPVQVLPVHIHCRDLMVFICRVVVNPLIRIVAGGVECDFIFSIGDLAASALLVNRT